MFIQLKKLHKLIYDNIEQMCVQKWVLGGVLESGYGFVRIKLDKLEMKEEKP